MLQQWEYSEIKFQGQTICYLFINHILYCFSSKEHRVVYIVPLFFWPSQQHYEVGKTESKYLAQGHPVVSPWFVHLVQEGSVLPHVVDMMMQLYPTPSPPSRMTSLAYVQRGRPLQTQARVPSNLASMYEPHTSTLGRWEPPALPG